MKGNLQLESEDSHGGRQDEDAITWPPSFLFHTVTITSNYT